MNHLVEYEILALIFVAAGILWLNAGSKEVSVEIKGIKLIQRTKFRWDVVSTSGHMMVEGVYFASTKHATDWAKAYISSWPAWTYELVLKEGV